MSGVSVLGAPLLDEIHTAHAIVDRTRVRAELADGGYSQPDSRWALRARVWRRRELWCPVRAGSAPAVRA